MLIGYARVSTTDQSLDLQLNALRAAGCETIFEDYLTGSRADRPGLERALAALSPGDSLFVWKLDRLGRSIANLIQLVGQLQKRDVQFVSLTDSINTATPSGRFFFHVMAALAEMERELIIERTCAGIKAAKQLGRVGGRPKRMTDSKVESARKLLSAGTPPREVARNLGVSVPTLYRWVPASGVGR